MIFVMILLEPGMKIFFELKTLFQRNCEEKSEGGSVLEKWLQACCVGMGYLVTGIYQSVDDGNLFVWGVGPFSGGRPI